jgi:hypothetical protein
MLNGDIGPFVIRAHRATAEDQWPERGDCQFHPGRGHWIAVHISIQPFLAAAPVI